MKRLLSVTTAVFTLVASGYFALVAHGQSAPELMLTWRTNAYAPPRFSGKILPPAGASIEAAVSLIDNGKAVNLAAYEVRWLLDDEVQRGKGMKTARFVASQDETHALRVSVLSYKGTDVRRAMAIPAAIPEAVIAPQEPHHVIHSGINLFRGLLYFFRIASLRDTRIVWSIRGHSTTGGEPDQDTLSLDAGEGPLTEGVFPLTVTVENLRVAGETDRATLPLITQ